MSKEEIEQERRLFAAMMLQGLMSNITEIKARMKELDIDHFAVERADALIKKLNESK